jgi:hypothetical protein
MSDELAERLPPLYERNIRRAAQGEQLYDLPASLQPLLAEFDRLLDVEHAAALLLDACDAREAAGMTTGAATVRQFLRDVRRTT